MVRYFLIGCSFKKVHLRPFPERRGGQATWLPWLFSTPDDLRSTVSKRKGKSRRRAEVVGNRRYLKP